VVSVRAPAAVAVTAVAWAVSLGGILAMAVIFGLTANGSIPPGPDSGWLVMLLLLLMHAPIAVVGALLVSRVPANAVGWLLWTAALLLAVSAVGQAYPAWAMTQGGPSTPATLLAWTASWSLQLFYALVIAFLALLFPTGRIPSPRWRPVLALAVLFTASSAIIEALAPGPLAATYPVPNPLGLEALPTAADGVGVARGLAILVIAAASVLAQVTRFRAGDPVQRQQVKWFGAVAIAIAVLVAVATVLPDEELANWIWALALMMLAALPISIGVAVLRYRLYDIDRIVSRTISWAVVTGLLACVFAGGVLILQAALAGLTQGQTVAVAGSTLLAFALFQPLRSRVQRAVDRRFDRARYDALLTADAFSARVRSEVDLGALRRGLIETVDGAVHPIGAALWLRGGGGSR
jgi:hypothetical protein